jgi:hypothetical protein
MIGGSGRSGTTVLARVFASHPSIATIPEVRLLTDPDGLLDFLSGYESWSPYVMDFRLKRLERFFRDLRRRGPFHRALRSLNRRQRWLRTEVPYSSFDVARQCPDFQELGLRLVEELTVCSFAGEHAAMRFGSRKVVRVAVAERQDAEAAVSRFLHRVAASAASHQHRTHFLEKNTWTLLHFELVRRLVPGARMVHIVRHPCDVVASFTKQPWMPSDPMQAALVLRMLMGRWRAARAAVPESSVLEVSLERVCADPRQSLGRICDWWGIPMSDSILSVDLTRSNAGRWRRDIPEPLHGRLEAELAREIEEFEAVHSG